MKIDKVYMAVAAFCYGAAQGMKTDASLVDPVMTGNHGGESVVTESASKLQDVISTLQKYTKSDDGTKASSMKPQLFGNGCKDDVIKFCSEEIEKMKAGNDGSRRGHLVVSILTCLDRNRSELSQACTQTMEKGMKLRGRNKNSLGILASLGENHQSDEQGKGKQDQGTGENVRSKPSVKPN